MPGKHLPKRGVLSPNVSKQMVKRVRRLNEVVIALEARTKTYFSITRLTIIKGLCADSAPVWAYHTARQYAEEYNPRYGTGLIPESLPHLKEIVRWWSKQYDVPIQVQRKSRME